MQLDQSENFFTDGMQVNLHVRSSNLNILWNVLESKRLLRSTFCERERERERDIYIHMLAGDLVFVFVSRNERSFKQIEIKT